MLTGGLNASELTLLHVDPGQPDGNKAGSATVFATASGVEKLRKKIDEFSEKLRPAKPNKEPRPYHANLVQSIGAIVEAGLRALWRSPQARFPSATEPIAWEIWLDKGAASNFLQQAQTFNITIGLDRLDFPEDIVVIGTATETDLATAVRRLAGVKALAAPTVTAEYFEDLQIEEQVDWITSIQENTRFASSEHSNYITLLDTGVSRSHPLIAPALDVADRHAAMPAWSVDDVAGHGTRMAGLALFGDLTTALQSITPIDIDHRLESAKVIPDAGQTPHHLLGAITRNAIDAVEMVADRRRTFTLASTTEDDTPHDGAPTSWSSEIDQLAVGVSGTKTDARLMVISAGNTDQRLFGGVDYLDICDRAENEIESPAHAWNAICVGAYTEKVVLPSSIPGKPLAPSGDLSPASRTASWASHWPIKPDVVLEGGNWVLDGMPPPLGHSALSLLTTHHTFPTRAFTTCADTSAATALLALILRDARRASRGGLLRMRA